MRVALFANGSVGAEVARYLRQQGDEVVALILHPEDLRREGDKILAAADVDSDRVLDGSRINDADMRDRLAATSPQIGVSVYFTYILRQPTLDLFPQGCVNLHPAYLPYNKGKHPNIWSIVERTPAGATLHFMDKGVDTGDIIARQEVTVSGTDTGETLYRKLESACVDLFVGTWPAIQAGGTPRLPQLKEEGTYHRAADVTEIDEIELDRQYTARYLIDVIRARTFPPYRGAYFVEDGRRTYLRLELLTEDDFGGES